MKVGEFVGALAGLVVLLSILFVIVTAGVALLDLCLRYWTG